MIEIKITGSSIPELADKMLAMGAALKGRAELASHDGATVLRSEERIALATEVQAIAAADGIAEKANEIAATKRTRKKAEPEAAPVTVVEDAAEEQVDTETGEVTVAIPPVEDVMEATLKAVERVGRDKVVAILSQFGAAKARDVPDAQRAEYIKLLGDA